MANAMYTGYEDIMSGFDTFIRKYPFFAVYNTTTLLWQGGDSEEDRNDLSMGLQAAEQSLNSDMLYIRFYDKSVTQPITNKTAYTATMMCRAVAKQGRGEPAIGQVGNGMLPRELYLVVKAMEGIPASFEAINKRLTDLEETEPEAAAPDTMIGKIGEFLSTPIGEAITNKVLGSLMGVPMPNAQVSGTGSSASSIAENNEGGQGFTEDQIDQIDGIIVRLSKHCDIVKDLELLAKLAETNPQMFKILLGQLRAV